MVADRPATGAPAGGRKTMRCPRCGRYGSVVSRARQGVGNRLAALFFFRPFACVGCRRRLLIFIAPFGLSDLD